MMMEEPTLSSSSSTYNYHFPSAQRPSLAFDLNNQEDCKEEGLIPKEPLFEKPLTPSDVGKLNRLVIPKQHAEKHFPINQIIGSGEKGLILSFEDELGKLWRFRYSYWNSSQSYVLTKGWSRFVKEKRLDAGDVVLFERHREDGDRHFIGWRRRRETESGGGQGAGGGGWRGVLVKGKSYLTQSPLGGPAVPYQPHPFHAAFQSSRTRPTANPKTLRLFGVNMECQPETDASGSPASTHGSSSYPNFYQYCYPNSETYNHYSYKQDITFGSDADLMEYQQE